MRKKPVKMAKSAGPMPPWMQAATPPAPPVKPGMKAPVKPGVKRPMPMKRKK